MSKLKISDRSSRVLRASPLAKLSLCSSELFHSNFIAWLCDNKKSEACHIFGEFLGKKPKALEAVKREFCHTDICITFDSGEMLVIENKVKSVPCAYQLEEYSNKKEFKGGASFVLLSPYRPDFFKLTKERYTYKIGGVVWNYLSYTELAKRLRKSWNTKTKAAKTYHHSLINDYADYIDALVELYSIFAVTNSGCFFSAIKECQKMLGDDGFVHGVTKMRYATLARMVEREFVKRKVCKASELETIPKRFWEQGKPGDMLVTSGFTHSEGLFDFKYLLSGKTDATPHPVALGVQIQGEKFCLFVERKDAPVRDIAKCLLADVKKHWFNLEKLALPTVNAKPHDGTKEFNVYNDRNKNEGFLYRYKKLNVKNPILPDAIIAAIIGYAEHLKKNSKALIKLVGRC